MGYFDFNNSNKDESNPFGFEGQGISLPKVPTKFIALFIFSIIGLFVFGALKEIYVNWLWFSATGSSEAVNYLSIYKTVLSAKITFFTAGFFISALLRCRRSVKIQNQQAAFKTFWFQRVPEFMGIGTWPGFLAFFT